MDFLLQISANLGFALLGDSLSFCLPKKKVSKEKGHPAPPSMAKSAIDALRASQVTAREKLAFGSNNFPLNPLLAAVLSGVEGTLVYSPSVAVTIIAFTVLRIL